MSVITRPNTLTICRYMSEQANFDNEVILSVTKTENSFPLKMVKLYTRS